MTHLPSAANSPGSARRLLGFLICTAAITAIASTALQGCRSRRPALLEHHVGSADAESLCVAVAGWPLPVSLQGKGNVRFRFEDRDLPLLNLRFALRDTGEVRALLRPGMFAPVLSLWAGQEGWSVRLPRQRTALEALKSAQAHPSDPGELSGSLVAHLAWYLLVPQAILLDLGRTRVIGRGAHWILSGRPGGVGPLIRSAEVWVEKEGLGISRWSLRLADGATLLQVVYDPAQIRPATGVRTARSVHFDIPSLEVQGTMRLERVKPAQIDPLPRPPIPPGWKVLQGFPLRQLLESEDEVSQQKLSN